MTYHQLTREQRYQIASYLECGRTQQDIAERLGVHKSTISRELKRNRNRTRRGYLPRHAHLAAMARRRGKGRRRLTRRQWAIVRRLLMRAFSPEQIAARARREGAFAISHEWIYRYIANERRAGGVLYQWLRSRKRRRKRYGAVAGKRGGITGRIGIERRPGIVARRRRCGDWEGDTVSGRYWASGIVTLIERKSRYTLLGRLEGKSAAHTSTVILRAFATLPRSRTPLTLTLDNGQEFAHHHRVADTLKTAVYFADPHSPWQRGTVENMNGLLRQYFPKRHDFRRIKQRELTRAQDALNHRPRKCLGYRTPHEVFFNTKTRLIGCG